MKIKKLLFWLIVDSAFVASSVLAISPYVASHSDLYEADSFVASAEESNELYPMTQTFSISAYYSPLPCQSYYVTGSYEGDIRLNGSGVNSADGTPVYPGMVAAPKSYAFGTKMYIPGIGIVAVHDRGGAIVDTPGSEIDGYLDIWMGYGDAGLTRALNWGRRVIDVTVYGVNDDLAEAITLDGYDPNEKAASDCSAPTTVQLAEATPEVPEPTVVEEPVIQEEAHDTPNVENSVPEVTTSNTLGADLKSGDSGEEVLALQKELSLLNYYKGEFTGVYDELTEHAVFKFQQSQSLVGDKESVGAGIFGPKTRDRMNEIIVSRNFTTLALVEANMWRVMPEDEIVNPQIQLASADVPFSSGFSSSAPKNEDGSPKVLTKELDLGVVSPDVEILQSLLSDAGYFKGALITDYFGPVTEQAVLDFQIANGIIKSAEDTGAGRVGPATLEALNKLFS